MQRRHLITAAVTAPFLSLTGLYAYAQVTDLSDAINKAGRQRMLSQRMAKAWLALAHGVEKPKAQQALDKSVALFEHQLSDLKAFAPTPEIKTTYGKLEGAWVDYKGALLKGAPDKAGASALLALDAKVLALAHQGTVQYDAVLGKPLGKLVNLAGRQRMLTQRMAKFYLASMLQVDVAESNAEIGKARSEFVAALQTLRNAPEATQRIKDELQVADGQWIFFDIALQKMADAQGGSKPLAEVFISSEHLLTVMDQVTNLYSAIKT